MRRLGLPLVTALGGILAAASAAPASVHDDWGPAAPVAAVNSAAQEGCPIESPDGLSLYLMSTRGTGDPQDVDQDIWVARRASTDEDFGTPHILPAPVNSPANDFCPTPLRGKGLLFVSTRGGTDAFGTTACGGGDMYLTRWRPASRTWAPPRNLGCAANGGPNTSGFEYGPSLVTTEAGTQLFFSSGDALPPAGTGIQQDIYVSNRADNGSFQPGQRVAELSVEGVADVMPNVRKDGLEVVFASTRLGGEGSFDIWSSTRSSVFDPWSAPVPLAAVNESGGETRPSLSWDGTRLYFGRAGEIFVSTR